MAKQGSLSINSENIFPIIKKWLYSDHDIFIRELVSNGCDAVTKLKKLAVMGEFEEADDEKYKVEVRINPTDKTLTFIDNGIGMTEEEVDEYINQIAFSGAAAFMEQYKDKASDEQIIGHFGLGFYSAFMVADKVTIDTLSYKEGAAPVHWECDGGTEFDMEEGDKAERGTVITLYLNDDSYEFCNEFRCREILDKYCSFMPVEIYFVNEEEEEKKAEEAAKKSAEEKVIDVEAKDADSKEEGTEEDGDSEVTLEEEEEEDTPKPINQIHPLWTKHPNDCTDEEYKEFYRDVFHDYKEPLFWIHLNMDYPFNLKGILYFPKINTKYDTIEGKIKLYNNQVFIADNIKEVIPEYLLLLKGCIDCPDLPLNVSRSALQNDGFVKKISNYITKKVAEKLSGMCKTDRENYEKYWDDISPFIKFGCLKDEKFGEKVKDSMLFKNLDHKYLTLEDCIKANGGETAEETKAEETTDSEETKETPKTNIFYVTNEQQQSQYINMFKEQGQDAVILAHNIDSAFITYLEQKHDNVKFQRIDADVHESLKAEVAEEEKETFQKNADSLTEIFRKVLNNEKLDVKVEKLKDENIASMAVLSEESRRMEEMMKMYGMGGMDTGMFGGQASLILNADHPLVQYVVENKEGENVELICKQLYDLALLAHKPLSPQEMTAFVQRSNQIMMLLTK